MDQQTINTYNQLSKEYDEETKNFWDKFPVVILGEFIKLTKGNVLDIGSGPGRDGLLLQEGGLNVTCLDASEAMIRLSKGRGLNSVLGDFSDLPFEDSSFGGVWAYTSLLHVPKININKPLTEIYRVLKIGGVFGLGLIEGEEEIYKESYAINSPRWFSYYKKSEIEELLNKHNFEIMHFEEFNPGKRKYLNFIAKKL